VQFPVQFPTSFRLLFTLDITDSNPNLNKDIARLYVPAKRMDRKIIRQANDYYDEVLDTPDSTALFSATVVREIITGYVGVPPRTAFCLRRRDKPPDDANKNNVILNCKEGDQPCDTVDAADSGLMSPALCGPKKAQRSDGLFRKTAFFTPRLVSEAHAEASSNVWSVPSLESLLERRNTRALRDGFTTFTLRSGTSLPVEADGVSIDLAVNDTPVLIGGVPADLNVVPFDRSQPFEVKFALQNLNFNGRYAGCDQIDVKLQF